MDVHPLAIWWCHGCNPPAGVATIQPTRPRVDPITWSHRTCGFTMSRWSWRTWERSQGLRRWALFRAVHNRSWPSRLKTSIQVRRWIGAETPSSVSVWALWLYFFNNFNPFFSFLLTFSFPALVVNAFDFESFGWMVCFCFWLLTQLILVGGNIFGLSTPLVWLGGVVLLFETEEFICWKQRVWYFTCCDQYYETVCFYCFHEQLLNFCHSVLV